FQKNYGRAYCDLKESNVAADVHDPDFDYDNWNLDDIDLTKWSFHVADKGTATVISTDNHTGPRDNMGHEETRSPENFLKGNNPDSRFDVFALGMFTYKLIHGEYFLKGEDPALFYKQKKDKEVKRKIKKNIARKLRKPLEKSLKINPDDRYTSVDDFVKDLNKRVVSEITEPRPILTTGILFGALGFFIIAAGGLGVYLRNKNVTLPELVTAVEEGKKYVEEGKKYKVEAKWDGETLEISNNLITLDIKANDYKEKKSFDSDELWHLNPGSKLNATMFVRDVARPRAREEIKGEVTPSLRGKVYIQGYSGEDFWISPGPHDQSFVNDMGTTIGYKYFDIKVPKDIPKGNHFLALEIYAPKEDEDDGYGEIHEKFIFSNPGKAIARKLIPILIGELEEKNRVNIGAMNLNWLNPYISMRSQEPRKVWYMTNDINTNLIYEVSIPEINYKKEFNREGDNTINSYWIRAGIPDAPSPGPRILQVVTKNKQEEPISYGWIPINWELTYTNSDGKENYEWALDIPGPDFCERLIDYRKNLMQKEGTK
ncbi:hypothetical protein KY348_06060, partial [Candidatus Woesearchaeota archaeon]|nr:hypothetical protein [Candidatus Woesearchaeota archaeon]